MTRAREAARLIGNNTFRLDSNNAVGFNSTTPDAMFDINSGLTVAGIITATGGFSGAVTGAATQVTVADESSDTTCFPLFVTAATGDLAPKSGTNLTFNSSTGTLETTNVTVTGDLTVQGTTTTLDTTLQEVDLINVQANAAVPAIGVTQSGSGDIAAFYDGTTEVFTVRDGGAVAIGNNGAVPGSNALVEIRSTTGAINSATLRVSGEKTTTGAVDTGATLLLSGHDGSSGRDFASVFAGKENGTGSNYSAYLAFGTRANGSVLAERLRITSAGNVSIQNDSGKFTVGAGDDLEIYHDGTHSNIENNTGELRLRSDDLRLQNNLATENYLTGAANGAVTVYYDNSAKLVTKSDGIDVTGEVQCDSLDVDGAADITGNVTLHANLDLQDNDKILLGTGDDFELYFDATYARIQSGSNTMLVRSNRIEFGDNGGNKYILCVDGAQTELYHNANVKLATKSDGVDITGELQCDSLDVDGAADITGDVTIADKIVHSGDTDTAIRFPAADTIATETAGTERLKINSLGTFDFTNGALIEEVQVTSGKLSDNTNINLDNGMVYLFTTAETTTSTPNIRINSTNTLDAAMGNGKVISLTIMTTAAAAGYFTTVTIDGNANGQNGYTLNVDWLGGSAPSEGGSSGIDVYNLTIIKQSSKNFNILIAQNNYA